MLDTDTFLTLLYVTVDDFCRQHRPSPAPGRAGRPGPAPALAPSEVVTLAVFAQFAHFASERDFYRFAQRRLRHLFPALPDRSQFSRLQGQHRETLAAFCLHLSHRLGAERSPYEVLDRCGVATRWCGRRGVGWLPEYTDKGWCSRLGYFQGLSLLTAVSAEGVITGFGVGPASAKDQPLALAFFAARHRPDPRLPWVGPPAAGGFYVVDKGFCGPRLHAQWRDGFGVRVVCAPRKGFDGAPWPAPRRRWLASLRQVVETVHDKLLNAFRLSRERPHDLGGFLARLSAKAALHNFCCLVNRLHGREMLAFADLIDW